MDESQPNALSADVMTLHEYHKRLSNLLDRMDRLEEALKAIPLVRPFNGNAIEDVEELEENSIKYQQLKEDNEDEKTVEKIEFDEKDKDKDNVKEKLEGLNESAE